MQFIDLKTQHSALKTAAIAIAARYTRSIDEQATYMRFAFSTGFPVSKCLVACVVGLPMSADLTEVDQDQVAAELRRDGSA